MRDLEGEVVTLVDGQYWAAGPPLGRSISPEPVVEDQSKTSGPSVAIAPLKVTPSYTRRLTCAWMPAGSPSKRMPLRLGRCRIQL